MNASADATTKECRHLDSDKKIISHKWQRDAWTLVAGCQHSNHSTEITPNYLV